jgi:hypothetical protein
MALSGQIWRRPVFDLVRTVPGEVPADLVFRPRKEDLTPLTNTYRTLGSGALPADQYRFSLDVSSPFVVPIPAKLGTERTDYVTAGTWGDELDVTVSPAPSPLGDPVVDFWYNLGFEVKAHQPYRENWLDAVVRSGDTSDGYGSLFTYEGQLTGYLAPFADASGHVYSGPAVDAVRWTLRRGSETVATGKDAYLDLKLPSGSRRYSLTAGVARSGSAWQRSTTVHTVWGFTVPDDLPPSPDPDVIAFSSVPTLRVDAKLPLDIANTARTGSSLSFPVSAGLARDAENKPVPADITRLAFATSTDGGKTWRPALVSRVDRDTFQVLVRNGFTRGPVAVRMSAAASNGSTIDQEVQAAYVLR